MSIELPCDSRGEAAPKPGNEGMNIEGMNLKYYLVSASLNNKDNS